MIEFFNVVIIVLLIMCAFFVLLENVRRYKCKMGFHAGHIKDGKLICHTCFKEICSNETK